jgi:hypothetical protein
MGSSGMLDTSRLEGHHDGTSRRQRRDAERLRLEQRDWWRRFRPVRDPEIAQLRREVDLLLVVVDELVEYINSRVAS